MWNQYGSTTVFVTPIYLFNILIGSAANLFVISSYLKGENNKKPFNFLIANFSLANLIQTAIFNPVLLGYRVFPSENIVANTNVCSVSLFSCMLAITMSFAVFPLLAYERHESINGRQLPLETAKSAVYFLWVASTAVALGYTLMVLVDTKDAPLDIKRDRCIVASQGIDYITISFLVFTMAEYGVAILLSFVYMKQPLVSMAESEPSEAQRTCKVHYVILATVLLWVPFTVIQFVGIFGTYSETTFNFHGCSSAIGLLAPALSPLLILKGGLGRDADKKQEKKST